MTNEERYALWLNFAVKADYNAQTRLLNIFGSASEVFKAPKSGVIKDALGPALAFKIKRSANEAYIDKCLKYLDKKNIGTVTLLSDNYPRLLKNIDDPPFVLYYRGELKRDIPLPITVVGSRRHSEYARTVAEDLSRQLCENGACIVSGMAIGLDSVASRSALETKSDYPTVVVLGSGVDVVYPAENEKLYRRIIERGAVISEFLPGTRPERWHFPFRNRIMSGLAKGVLIVEARERSGTSITANKALEQGRDVFAVPGRITDNCCKGSNAMIREGFAKPVFCVEDILEEYAITAKVNEKQTIKIDPEKHSVEELVVIKLLQAGERSIDELAVMTKYEIFKLNSVLTELEFSGIIKQLPGRIYEIMPDVDF